MINKLWYVFLIDKNYVLISLSLSFSFSLSENFLMTIPPSKGLLIILVKKIFLSYTYRKIQKPVLVERLRGHLIFSTSNQTILTVLVVISAIPTVLRCIIKWSIRGITSYIKITYCYHHSNQYRIFVVEQNAKCSLITTDMNSQVS